MRTCILILVLGLALTNTGCSSFAFSKKAMLVGLATGSLTGLAVGALTHNENKSSWGALGAGVGGSLGALAVMALSKDKADPPEVNAKLLESVLNRESKDFEVNSYPILPRDIPKEVRSRFKAPKVSVGRTNWMELEGQLHEPHKYYFYEEGGLVSPSTR